VEEIAPAMSMDRRGFLTVAAGKSLDDLVYFVRTLR